MGGYCYLNNAAVAAQAFLDEAAPGGSAVLDVDYHHGNGTQSIFYDRADVLVCNIHADPTQEYPYFLGYADETRRRRRRGLQRQLPLAAGAPTFEAWGAALDHACAPGRRTIAPDVLVVSLGVDTYKDDPISQFRLESPDYLRDRRPHRGTRPADALRDGGRLRGRGDRRQRRQHARGILAAVIVTIEDPADPRIAPYLDIRERDLRGRGRRFVIEGEVVLRVAAARAAAIPSSRSSSANPVVSIPCARSWKRGRTCPSMSRRGRSSTGSPVFPCIAASWRSAGATQARRMAPPG